MSTENQKALTKAQAAGLVKRSVFSPKMVEGKAVKGALTEKQVPVKADEVLDFKDYGDRVVVVTNDGQKFEGAK